MIASGGTVRPSRGRCGAAGGDHRTHRRTRRSGPTGSARPRTHTGAGSAEDPHRRLGRRAPHEDGRAASGAVELKVWITSRTVSSSAATSRAIAETGVPDEDAMMIVARRTRIGFPRPRRTIWVSAAPHDQKVVVLVPDLPPAPHAWTSTDVEIKSGRSRRSRGGRHAACRQPGERGWSTHQADGISGQVGTSGMAGYPGGQGHPGRPARREHDTRGPVQPRAAQPACGPVSRETARPSGRCGRAPGAPTPRPRTARRAAPTSAAGPSCSSTGPRRE